jgi:hypothetical protein
MLFAATTFVKHKKAFVNCRGATELAGMGTFEEDLTESGSEA